MSRKDRPRRNVLLCLSSPAVAERDVLLNEAERLGIALSEDELRTQSSVLKEVLSALGEDGAVLRENFRKDLLTEKMRHRMRCAIAERIPQISSEDIAREQAAVAKHNAGLAIFFEASGISVGQEDGSERRCYAYAEFGETQPWRSPRRNAEANSSPNEKQRRGRRNAPQRSGG